MANAQMDEKKLLVEEEIRGERLDKYLAGAELGLTRERLKNLIKQGHVLVNGAKAKGPSVKINAGDELRVTLPEPESYDVEAEDIPLDILFEDEQVLVLNKPAYMVVHPAPGNWSGTLVNALLHHCGESLKGIGGVQRPGIVHRLDKDTSGVMVIAKTEAASLSLTTQFSDHSIERRYRAIVWGRPTPLVGKVDAPIGRHPNARTKMAVVQGPNGKRACTHYKVLKSFGPADKPLASLVECRLETGRTHQVRVHMTSLGHPLVGDAVYGPKRKMDYGAEAPFPRQALHAFSLEFEHPISYKRLKFESPLPHDMEALLRFLETSAEKAYNK